MSLDLLLLFYHRYFILSTFVLQSMDFYFLMTKSYFKKIQIKNMWWLICLMYVGKTHLLMCYYNNLNKKSTNNLIRSSSVDNWIYIQFILNKYLCKLWLQHRLWPKFRIVYFFHYLLNISGNVKEISTIWWINYIKIIIIKRELRAFFILYC